MEPKHPTTSTDDSNEATEPDALRVPHINVQAFCESTEVAGVLAAAAADRRMARTDLKIGMGGSAAALELYRHEASPDLILIESDATRTALLDQLDRLAQACGPDTKVIVIGQVNDIQLYRDLLGRGVSEYLVAPLEPLAAIAAIARLYRDPGAGKLGHTYAFIGSKGGVGSSAVAHNVAWSTARLFGSETVLVDFDLPFGTMDLNFGQNFTQGFLGTLQGAAALDEVLLERLMVRYDDRLRLLGSPGGLEQTCDFGQNTFDSLVQVLQSSIPFIVFDVPHVWAAWTSKLLLAADDVVITATPDLASFKNAKNLVELLKASRPNDALPKLVLNQVGAPRRPEIKPEDFARRLGLEPTACLSFDPALFGGAANLGKMIGEIAPRSSTARSFSTIAQVVTKRREPKRGLLGRLNPRRLWAT